MGDIYYYKIQIWSSWVISQVNGSLHLPPEICISLSFFGFVSHCMEIVVKSFMVPVLTFLHILSG